MKRLRICLFINILQDPRRHAAVRAQIAENDIDALIFLRDPDNPKPNEPNVNDVVRLCDVHNIPMATNVATAELIIHAIDRGDLDWREIYK